MSEYEAPKEYVDELKALAKIQEELMSDPNIEFELKPIPPTRRKMGELVLCPEGERLYSLYCMMTDDDEMCFTQAHKDAFDAWIEHKNNCAKCGYV